MEEMRAIYHYDDALRAETELEEFARQLQKSHPDVAGSLHEGLGETLSVMALKGPPTLSGTLRPTNAVESTFATVRLRTKVTKGAGSRSAGLAMAYKLIATAESRWRAVNAPHLVALVRAGALFHNGVLVERSEEVAA
jgi:transposase-like protein